MEEINKVEQVATPATDATSVENKPTDTTTAVVDTTTTKNEVKTETNVVGEASTKSKDGLPPGVKKRLWEQAEKIRKMEAEIEKYKTTPTQTTNTTAEQIADTTNDTEVNLLDDPNKWAGSVEKKILAQAENNILAKIRQAEAEKKITQEASEAKEYLLSQPEMTDEVSIGEIHSIIATPEVQALCSVSPKKGAEYALDMWKKAKGIDTASVAKANANAAKSASVNPSGTPTGKKVWSRNEITKYLADYKHPDFNARKAEIHLAIQEGRIQ